MYFRIRGELDHFICIFHGLIGYDKSSFIFPIISKAYSGFMSNSSLALTSSPLFIQHVCIGASYPPAVSHNKTSKCTKCAKKFQK